MDLLGDGMLDGLLFVYMCFGLAWALVIEGPEFKQSRREGRYIPRFRFPLLPGMVMLLQAMLVSATFAMFLIGLVNRARDLGGYAGEIAAHSPSVGPFLRAMPFIYGVAIFFAALVAAGFRLIGKSFAAGAAAGDRS